MAKSSTKPSPRSTSQSPSRRQRRQLRPSCKADLGGRLVATSAPLTTKLVFVEYSGNLSSLTVAPATPGYKVLGTGYTTPEDVKLSSDGVHAYVTERTGDLVKVALSSPNRSAATVITKWHDLAPADVPRRRTQARLCRRIRLAGRLFKINLTSGAKTVITERSPFHRPHSQLRPAVRLRQRSVRAHQRGADQQRHHHHPRHRAHQPVLPHLGRRRAGLTLRAPARSLQLHRHRRHRQRAGQHRRHRRAIPSLQRRSALLRRTSRLLRCSVLRMSSLPASSPMARS